MSSYEAWLDLSVDHVVPRNVVKRLGYPIEWVEDLVNLRTCCRACNEFLNQFKVADAVPTDLGSFVALVAATLEAKREWVMRRHVSERAWYDEWMSSSIPSP